MNRSKFLLFLGNYELANINLGESHSVVYILNDRLSPSPTVTHLIEIFQLSVRFAKVIFKHVLFEFLVAFHAPVVPSIT